MRRPKSFLRLCFGPAGWGAAFCALFLVSSLVVTMNASRTAARLDAEGATETATITGMDVAPRRPGMRPRGDRYTVSYAFPVGAASQTGSQTVSGSFFRAHAVGDEVPVRYWTQDPALSEIELGEAAYVSQAGIVICLLAALGALGLGRSAWRHAVAASWVARKGQRHRVRILDHEPALFRVNGALLWRATWRAPDGTPGASLRHRKSALPPVGAEVTILVDPGGRHPSQWEADVCA